MLNDSEVQELGESIINIEKYYGKPQDMEWAFEKGKLYILQSRPVTTLEKSNEKTSNTIIWDNSNIVESYPEITLPLTFSFIRKAYLLAVERDETTAALATVNLMTLEDVEVRCADALAVDLEAEGVDAVFADPSRRRAGRRIADPEGWSPPLGSVLAH